MRGTGATIAEPEDADVLVWLAWDPEALKQTLERGPGIRWIQLPSAGVEALAAAGAFDPSRTWVCAKGTYGPPVAEHGIALMLAAARHLYEYIPKRTWGAPALKLLEGSKALMLGGGGIAVEMIRRLQPFGVECSVVRKHPEPVEGAVTTVGIDGMDTLIPGADWIVLALALTPETTGIVDARFFEKMKNDAWVINLARGRHIVTDDLVAALHAGSIGGAALDVTDPEPLPDGHPLWSFENVIITPHSANTMQHGLTMLAKRVADNLERDRRGEPLEGLIDPKLGY